MKKLPFGIQEFSKLIEGDFIYVDKTRHIYELLQHHYYFLSRPRRFGKSLLLNTIKEIFLGNKELFKGLWIYDKIDWQPHPVIKISFSNLEYNAIGLEAAIDKEMNRIAQKHNIVFDSNDKYSKFRALIKTLGQKSQLVILIDEYDKPIIDYLTNIEKAQENREILKNFYAIIKDSDQYIRFFFITGVSKFSKVSIFSDLNNLDDITLDRNFSTLLGWTQDEIEHYFGEYIDKVQQLYAEHHADIKPIIKEWYNGYSWDGKNFVYNPVSLMNLFNKQVFNNYWFATGTPTFLMQKIKDEQYTAFDIEKRKIDHGLLDKYSIENMSLLPLLFQTGYLTIKEYDIFQNTIVLDYPNKEVADSFTRHILSELTIGKMDKSNMLLDDMGDAFDQEDIDKFISQLNILFKNIPYSIIENKEKYFHSIFYMVMKLIGYKIECEILTIDGRIDAVVLTEKNIFIIEFKIDQDADAAIRQIKDKAYALKYQDDKRDIKLIGINFDSEKHKIDDWQIISS
jgi:hypothetical protein